MKKTKKSPASTSSLMGVGTGTDIFTVRNSELYSVKIKPLRKTIWKGLSAAALTRRTLIATNVYNVVKGAYPHAGKNQSFLWGIVMITIQHKPVMDVERLLDALIDDNKDVKTVE